MGLKENYNAGEGPWFKMAENRYLKTIEMADFSSDGETRIT